MNAIIATLNKNQARLRAQEADEALSRRRGSLHGVAITVKDYFETAGLRTTCSYKALANYIPKTDATAVARLKAAGAIILAKMNMPKQAVGFQTDSPLLGRANNLWNLECTPGVVVVVVQQQWQPDFHTSILEVMAAAQFGFV
ncbi:MAG: hypothetical protein BRC43_15000 [Cyanobacteria bacterium QS_3_48_167]|nr:MAG: hypothetical protein BRC43_15000 [Cyanobacteria bacterium QS_3_48_167]